MGHHHDHDVQNYSRAFAIGIILNVVFVIIEFGFGLYSDSLALVADAGHNLSDVVSLLLAWGASALASRPATETRTYGFKKATILASLASAIILLFALGAIAWEAVGRFNNPAHVEGATMIIVAAIGVFINTVTALLFVRGQKEDLNIRGAFLHMAADAGVSLGVVISGVIIIYTGWLWVDPVISLLIVAVVFVGTWNLLHDSVNFAMDCVPESVDVGRIRQYLLDLDRVCSIHDLHVWPLSTTEVALTVHLVVSDESLDNDFVVGVQSELHDRFKIEHSTIQVEIKEEKINCRLVDNC